MGIYDLSTARDLLSTDTMAFPSTCTVKEPNTTENADGQAVPGFTAVTGLSNIPCRLAPEVKERPAGGYIGKPDFEVVMQTQHVLLSGYYPTIIDTEGWVAVVDGTTYKIYKVENGGNHLNTRLRLQHIQV